MSHQITKPYDDTIGVSWNVENIGDQPGNANVSLWLIDPLLGDIIAIEGPWQAVPGREIVELLASGQLPIPAGDYLGYIRMDDPQSMIGSHDFWFTLAG